MEKCDKSVYFLKIAKSDGTVRFEGFDTEAKAVEKQRNEAKRDYLAFGKRIEDGKDGDGHSLIVVDTQDGGYVKYSVEKGLFSE